MAVDSILIICALLKAYQRKRLDPDSKQRIQVCLRILTNPSGLNSLSATESVLVDQGRRIYGNFLENHSKLAPAGAKGHKKRKGEETLLIT